MQTTEKKTLFALSAILALRLLGIMMILPVLALYTSHFTHATPLLIGIALGIYGLTQAALQLPFGMLSDKIGRKPIMTLGFFLLFAGSTLCAISHHIVWLIIGRALQGACAISSTLMATLADLIRSTQRAKAMAVIGATMGFVFSTSVVAGAVLNHWLGIKGLFALTAVLSLIAIVVIHTYLPTPQHATKPPKNLPLTQRLHIGLHPALWRINISIMLQHALLIANFTALPPLLQHIAQLPSNKLWHLYLPTMLIAFAIILPLIRFIEKKRCFKPSLLINLLLLGISEAGLWLFHSQLFFIFISLTLFFTAFSLLEALLPSLASRLAPHEHKGTAMGFYSSSQFIGMFLGGLFGGLISHYFSNTPVFLFCAVICFLWLLPLKGIPLSAIK